jgi:hypothetical protein
VGQAPPCGQVETDPGGVLQPDAALSEPLQDGDAAAELGSAGRERLAGTALPARRDPLEYLPKVVGPSVVLRRPRVADLVVAVPQAVDQSDVDVGEQPAKVQRGVEPDLDQVVFIRLGDVTLRNQQGFDVARLPCGSPLLDPG